MKKLLLIGLVLLSSMSSHACECESKSYSDIDAQQAIVDFMVEKLNIESSQVIRAEKLSADRLSTVTQKAILGILSIKCRVSRNGYHLILTSGYHHAVFIS